MAETKKITGNDTAAARTGNDIVIKALAIIRSGSYVYWYGGKGEKCTADRLYALANLYPAVYTSSYIAACKQDIAKNKMCIDCSGFVSKVYGWGGLGTYGIAARTDVHDWHGKEMKNGLICWRPSHCAIYYDGNILESRGKAYGLCAGRKFNRKDWTHIYAVDGVDYEKYLVPVKKRITDKVVSDVIKGVYGNGDVRKNKLLTAGFTMSQIEEIQKKVNERLKA